MSDGVAGIAKKIQDIDILGIPIGAAALGGGSALVLSELTEGLLLPRLPTMHVAAVKAGETYAMHRWGHKAIGAGGARIATFFLAYSTLTTLLPMEQWIKDVIAKLTGILPNQTQRAAKTPAPQPENPGNGHQQGDAMTTLRDSLIAQGGGA